MFVMTCRDLITNIQYIKNIIRGCLITCFFTVCSWIIIFGPLILSKDVLHYVALINSLMTFICCCTMQMENVRHTQSVMFTAVIDCKESWRHASAQLQSVGHILTYTLTHTFTYTIIRKLHSHTTWRFKSCSSVTLEEYNCSQTLRR